MDLTAKCFVPGKKNYERIASALTRSRLKFNLLVTWEPKGTCNWITYRPRILCTRVILIVSEKKRKRSSSVLWQKPLYQQKCQTGKVTTQKRYQNVQYTAIMDRLKTVSWSNYSHPAGLINRFMVPTSDNLPTPRNSRIQKDTFVNKLPNKDNNPTATPSGEVININTQTA